MSDQAARIEALLLSRKGWVSGDEIAAALDLDKRQLRASDGRPGLCAGFAIASTKGFKHLRYASREEAYGSYRQRRKHSIGQLVGARAMIRAWEAYARPETEAKSQAQPLPRCNGAGQGFLF